MPSPRLWAECWTRPGHATFGRVIAEIPVNVCSGTVVVNGIGEGWITIPKNYARLDEILKPDVATPANAVSSLIRVFSERSTTPIFEFIPIQFEGEQDKADLDLKISGPAIDSIWGHARLEAWDWTGADDEKSSFPDWIWGGRDILGELESAYDPAIINVWVDADGGTFTLGVSINGGAISNTSAIAYNASAATVEAAIEALSNVVDVTVSGTGTATDPWHIQAVDPEAEYSWSKSAAGLVGPWQIRQLTATGGTFTLTVDGQTTVALAFGVSAATMKTEIEALSTVTTCTVTKFGSGADVTWIVYFTTPDTVTTFTVTDSTTPTPPNVVVTHLAGTALFGFVNVGTVLPQGWTASFNPVTNLVHFPLAEFRISDFTGSDPTAPACDTSGFAIMFDANAAFGLEIFPGVQKIVTVKPGGRYYASVWAYAQGASETYRFVIRDLYENGIAADPGFTTGTTISADTWTQFFIPIVDIPADVERVIFRFAATTTNNIPPTFIACMELREGMPPDTWGEYLTQLFDDATLDHAPGRVVWEDGTTNLPYLGLDFTPTLDSNGNAYTDAEVNITLKRGQNYLRVLSEAYKMGYEGRIVPDDVANGTWMLQFYNSQGMMVDYSLVANGPSIQGGRDVTRRDLRRYMPSSTDVAVEGASQNIARAQDAGAVTALGRIEAYQPNQDLGTLIEASTVADQSLTQSLSRTQSLTYILTPSYTDPQPFIDYVAGDTIYVMDPPDLPTRTARRIKSLQFTFTKDTVQYTVQLESQSYAGVGPALAASTDFLMKEFKAIRAVPPEPTDILNYFTDPCCPSCPTHAYPSIVISSIVNDITGSFDWIISGPGGDDLSVDAGGNLFLVQPGLYTIDLNLRFGLTFTQAGVAQIDFSCSVDGNDAGNGAQTVTAVASGAFGRTVLVHIRFWAHTEEANKQLSFSWSVENLNTYPVAGIISTATLPSVDIANGNYKELTVVRHSDGCASERSCA